MSSALALEYETAFRNLFEAGVISQASLGNLRSFYHETKDNSEFRPNMEKILQYVEANPMKTSVGAALAACTWLVYQSIGFGARIDKFICEQKHHQLGELRVPRLDHLYGTIRGILLIAEQDPAQLKSSFLELFRGLTEFYRELQRVMDLVEDTTNVHKAKMAAVKNTATCGCIAVLAGFGIATESPSTINPLWWKRGALSTLAFSCVFMFVSLKKIYDLSNVAVEFDDLKQRLRLLRNQYVTETMIDIVEVS